MNDRIEEFKRLKQIGGGIKDGDCDHCEKCNRQMIGREQYYEITNPRDNKVLKLCQKCTKELAITANPERKAEFEDWDAAMNELVVEKINRNKSKCPKCGVLSLELPTQEQNLQELKKQKEDLVMFPCQCPSCGEAFIGAVTIEGMRLVPVRDIPDNCIVGGNPFHKHKQVFEDEKK